MDRGSSQLPTLREPGKYGVVRDGATGEERLEREGRPPKARRFPGIAVLVVVLSFLPACFTIGTQFAEEREGSRVFTGTRAHLRLMVNPTSLDGDVFFNNYWIPAFGMTIFWLPFDFPLSLAADLVILPYTVPAQLIWGDYDNDQKVRFASALDAEVVR